MEAKSQTHPECQRLNSQHRGTSVELTSGAACWVLSHTSLFLNSELARITTLTYLTVVISANISLAWPLILQRNPMPRFFETCVNWFMEANFCSGFCWACNFQSHVSVDHWSESLDLDCWSRCAQLPLSTNLTMLLTFFLLHQLSVPPAEVNHHYDFCGLRSKGCGLSSKGWTHFKVQNNFRGSSLELTNCIVVLCVTVLLRSKILPTLVLHQLAMPLTICRSHVLSIIPVSNFSLIEHAIQSCNETIFALNQFIMIVN